MAKCQPNLEELYAYTTDALEELQYVDGKQETNEEHEFYGRKEGTYAKKERKKGEKNHITRLETKGGKVHCSPGPFAFFFSAGPFLSNNAGTVQWTIYCRDPTSAQKTEVARDLPTKAKHKVRQDPTKEFTGMLKLRGWERLF